MFERLAFERFVAKRNFCANAPRRCERNDLIDRESPFIQNGEKFTAHIACGADNRDFKAHCLSPKIHTSRIGRFGCNPYGPALRRNNARPQKSIKTGLKLPFQP
jgi:hypothetical protein